MSILGYLFGARGRSPRMGHLSEDVSATLARCDAVAAPDLGAPLSTQRWLVVDVESTGLNTRLDRLLAIGAVLVEGSTIHFDRSFEVVIRQATASTADNILIHRIAGGEQLEGVDASSALATFLEYSRKLPCVGFHAQFDEAMLKRAFEEQLGIEFPSPFLDLASLAPALVREAPAKLRSLDDWVGHFSIKILARHRAVADAVGTAQLFQVLLSRAAEQDCHTADALFRIAREQSWLTKLDRR